jgi:hypothetical protein
MTETLHRPADADKLALVEKDLRSVQTLSNESPTEHTISETPTSEVLDSITLDYENGTEADRPISPLAERIRGAAERFATRLEKRALSRAHDAALKEYRARDIAEYSNHVDRLSRSDEDYADHYKSLQKKEDRIADREELIEGATLQLRALGGLALEKTAHVVKEAGYIGIGLGAIGYEAAAKKARGASLKLEMASANRQFKKTYARETKAFDKSARKETKTLLSQQKAEMKHAVKEDKKFERDMRRKQSAEKWDARKEAVIVKLENGARRTGKAYRATKESYETVKSTTVEKKRKLGAFTLKAKAVGQDAVAAKRRGSNG